MIDRRSLLGHLIGVQQDRSGFYECRLCGSTVDDPFIRCQRCDSQEIAYYEV